MKVVGLLGLVLLIAGCQSGTGAKVAQSTKKFPEKTGFVERHIKVDGQNKTVWVFLPPDYNPNRLYPAILFLHGLFENGDGNGNSNVLSAGIGPIIARNPERWPFITIFPQSTGSWQGAGRERLALAALKDSEHEFNIDPDRVILAGLSFGGLGVWEIGSNNPDRFAALVPVSGPATTRPVADLAGVPIWAFASKEDPFVNSNNAEQMRHNIEALGGHMRLTEFDGNEHDCWVLAVDQSNLIGWMLNQARNPLRVSTSGTSKTSTRLQASGRLRSYTEP